MRPSDNLQEKITARARLSPERTNTQQLYFCLFDSCCSKVTPGRSGWPKPRRETSGKGRQARRPKADRRAVASRFAEKRQLSRRGEDLRPVHARAAARAERERDAHLGELRGHDVRAMARAVEPLGDDRLRARLSRGDVLADRTPRVARAGDALGGLAAVGARVADRAASRHV